MRLWTYTHEVLTCKCIKHTSHIHTYTTYNLYSSASSSALTSLTSLYIEGEELLLTVHLYTHTQPEFHSVYPWPFPCSDHPQKCMLFLTQGLLQLHQHVQWQFSVSTANQLHNAALYVLMSVCVYTCAHVHTCTL